ncbi:MAG: CpsD/CapB family tyrosine-protein kinase [Nitrospiria bacterium]
MSRIQPHEYVRSRPRAALDLNGSAAAARSRDGDRYLVSADDPLSIAAEQYRLLAARLEGIRAGQDLRAVGITSTLPGEGKTVTAMNLAYVLAKDFGRRVLLIDGDLKKPAVWRYAGDDPRPGLADLMADPSAGTDAYVHQLRHESLYVLEAGVAPVNPTRLWRSSRVKELFARARQEFDYLIVDTPPVLTLVDTTLIANLIDGIAVVVRAGMTPKGLLQKALKVLPGDKILGTVFNGAPMPRTSYYYYQLR